MGVYDAMFEVELDHPVPEFLVVGPQNVVDRGHQISFLVHEVSNLLEVSLDSLNEGRLIGELVDGRDEQLVEQLGKDLEGCFSADVVDAHIAVFGKFLDIITVYRQEREADGKILVRFASVG